VAGISVDWLLAAPAVRHSAALPFVRAYDRLASHPALSVPGVVKAAITRHVRDRRRYPINGASACSNTDAPKNAAKKRGRRGVLVATTSELSRKARIDRRRTTRLAAAGVGACVLHPAFGDVTRAAETQAGKDLSPTATRYAILAIRQISAADGL
jgi:hypothetical protein